ncbi:hypothetical protein ACSTIX_24120, partial [Vibrio parahaemolyticus]
VKIDSGAIEVRHGGFWDLREWQIPEQSIRGLEAIRAPDLNDYGDFAFGIYLTPAGQAFPPALFDSQQAPLTRFDPRPLQDSFIVLL